jgi:GAF domain-containing protein
MLYGFESYASIPIFLADGSFYGTLCAIDPEPRRLSGPETIALLKDCAQRVAAILSRKRG